MKRTCKNCLFCVKITPKIIKILTKDFYSINTSFGTPEDLQNFLAKYEYVCLIPDGLFPALNSGDSFDCPVSIAQVIFMTKQGIEANAKDCEYFTPKNG